MAITRHLDWRKTLKLLKANPSGTILPANTNCPICQHQRLKLIADSLTDSVWAHCSGCGFAGDLFALSQKVWGLTGKATALKLSQNGAITNSGDISRQVEIWEASKKRRDAIERRVGEAFAGCAILRSREAIALSDRLGLKVERRLLSADKTTGRLVGFGYVEPLTGLLEATTSRKLENAEERYQALIAKERATPCLVIPFCDVPGRIASFATITEAKNAAGTKIQTHFIPQETAVDGGVAMPRDCRDREMVLTDDIELYLRLHIKHNRESARALPLGCYHPRTTSIATWQHVSSKSAVFLASRLTPQVVWHAMQVDARIALLGPQIMTPREYVDHRSPYGLIETAVKSSVTWPEAIANRVRKLDDTQLSDWLADMRLSENDKQHVIDTADPKDKKVLEQALRMTLAAVAIPIKAGFVTQKPSGWYYSARQHELLVTDAPFRVLRAYTGGSTRYLVEVFHNKNQFTFLVDKEKFEKEPFQVVQEQAIAGGYGVPTYDRKWSSTAMHLSLQFYTPQVLAPLEVVGVDHQRQAIRFPKFDVGVNTGAISTTGHLDHVLPFQALEPQVTTAKAKRDWILASPGYVSGVLAYACSLLRMTVGHPALRITYDNSPSVAVTQKMQHVFGVYEKVGKYSELIKYSQKHATPLFAAINDQGGLKKLLASEVTNLVFPQTFEQAVYGLLRGNSMHLQITSDTDDDASPMQELLVSLLQFVTKNRLLSLFASEHASFKTAVQLFREWCSSSDARIRAHYFTQLRNNVLTSEDLAEVVASITAQLIHTQQLSICDARKQKPDPDRHCYLTARYRKYFVAYRSIMRVLKESGTPTVSIHELSLRLNNTSGPIALTRHNNQYGFSVSRKLIDAAVNRSRQLTANHSNILRA